MKSVHSQQCADAMTLKALGTRDFQGDRLSQGDRVIFAPEAGILREGIVLDECAERCFAMIAIKSTRSEDVMLVEPTGCIRVPA